MCVITYLYFWCWEAVSCCLALVSGSGYFLSCLHSVRQTGHFIRPYQLNRDWQREILEINQIYTILLLIKLRTILAIYKDKILFIGLSSGCEESFSLRKVLKGYWRSPTLWFITTHPDAFVCISHSAYKLKVTLEIKIEDLFLSHFSRFQVG